MAFSVKQWFDRFGSGGFYDQPTDTGDVPDTPLDAAGQRDQETRLSAYTDSTVAAHTGAATGAHAASAISFSPTGSVGSTTAQAAIAEVASEAASALTSGLAGKADLSGGHVPVAQLASGTPDGTKFVRDDGTLAVPPGTAQSGSGVVQEDGAVTVELSNDLNGATDLRSGLGVGPDGHLYYVTSGESGPDFCGVKRLQRGASEWETLHTWPGDGPAIGVGPGMVYQGKLYFRGWGGNPGSIYRLDINEDGTYDTLTILGINAGQEDAHFELALWNQLWVRTFANSGYLTSSGIGASMWHWPGTGDSVNAANGGPWLGDLAFANSSAFVAGKLWVAVGGLIDDVSRSILYSIGGPPDYVAEPRWVSDTVSILIAEWNGELVAFTQESDAPLSVWRENDWVPISEPFPVTGSAPNELFALGNRLVVLHPAPYQVTRGGGWTELVLPDDAAGSSHACPVYWDGALWWLTTQGNQQVFRMEVGRESLDLEHVGVQQAVGGLERIEPSQLPRVTGRDLVIDTGATFRDTETGEYHQTVVTGGALVVTGLGVYSAPDADHPDAPTCTAIPEVTGTPTIGETLTCSDGTWSNSPTDISKQWTRDGVDILQATSDTYDLAVADSTHDIACVVTAVNADGFARVSALAVTADEAAAAVLPETTLGSKKYAIYRAEAEAGGDGTSLAQMTDQTGNGLHIPGASGHRTVKETGIANGKAVYRFNGTDQRHALDLGSVIAQNALAEVYMVCKMRTAFSGAERLIIGAFSAWHISEKSSEIQVYAGSFGCTTTTASNEMSDAFHAWRFQLAGASSSISKDGTTLVTGDAGSTGIQYLGVGGDQLDANWADIDIAEIVISNAALSGPEAAALLYYFQVTYGTP